MGRAFALVSGSTDRAVPSAVRDLTISAAASPSTSNVLYPGSDGDVVLTITNPNRVPATATGMSPPPNTTYASGYTSSALSTAQAGCSLTTSDVTWNFSTAASYSAYTLTIPLLASARGTLTVTRTNEASTTTSAPTASENAYFSMPSLTSIAATAGAGTATASSVTDGWTR